MAEKKKAATEKKSDDQTADQGYKRIFRSSSDKMIAGICGGLAEYCGIDLTLIRIIFVILCFISGTGLIVYLIGWIIIPVQEDTADSPSTSLSTLIGTIIGALIILWGFNLMFRDWLWIPHWFDIVTFWRFVFSLIVIGVGVIVLTKTLQKRDEADEVKPKAHTASKTIYRSTTNKRLSGVCGGIGEYFSIDPTVVRILWIIGTLISHVLPGIIIYFVMAYIVPETPVPNQK